MKNITKPPRLAELLLFKMSKYEKDFSFIGDLAEEFELEMQEGSAFNAKSRYWVQVLFSVPPYLKFMILWSLTMLKNYIKISLRNFKKQKFYSIINISGLAVGMACCILMMLWVQNETSYEKYQENLDVLHRVIFEKHIGNDIYTDPRGANALGPVLMEEYPEIVNFARFRNGITDWHVRYKDKSFLNDEMCTADQSFFELFTFEFLKGDPETVFKDPLSMVITEAMALKYFGDEDPMGKSLNIESRMVKVTGVIKNHPRNTHITFDYVIPIVNMERAWGDPLDSWSRDFRFYTFVLLRNDAVKEEVDKKISGVVKKNYPESTTERIYLQPLKDIHLHSGYDRDFGNTGNINSVYIFTLTAFCILLIACINFMNLSTARSSTRAKEIGMRKVSGAFRKDIIKQFLGESVLLSFFALFFAVVLAYIFLPVFNELSGKQLLFSLSDNFSILSGMVIIALFTGILSGSYPALFLSSFQPVQVIKGNLFKKEKNRSLLRKVLVAVQFTLSIFLLTGSVVVYNQLNFLNSKPLGFDKSSLLTFSSQGLSRHYGALKNKLLKSPDIINMTQSTIPLGMSWRMEDVNWEGKKPNEDIGLYRIYTDYDYLETLKIEMAEGRYFSKEFPSDSSNYIFNEESVKVTGIKNPVGKRFSFEGREGIIVGVIKNFHHGSLHRPIQPLVLTLTDSWFTIAARISSKNVPETLALIKNARKEFIPDRPFFYEFLNEKISNFYKAEQKTGVIFKYFTFLAVFISCLGLFGLASFTAEQRTTERGIR